MIRCKQKQKHHVTQGNLPPRIKLCQFLINVDHVTLLGSDVRDCEELSKASGSKTPASLISFYPRGPRDGTRRRPNSQHNCEDTNHNESCVQPYINRGPLHQYQGHGLPSWIPCRLRSSWSSIQSQCLCRSKPSLPQWLCPGHSFQNVLLSQHRDCATILFLTQPLSCLPSQEHLPPTESLCTGINTFTTTRHLLHTATVCCTAPCYPSHNSGPAKWYACSHVCPAHTSSPPQWCHHGDGSRHHHGHVSWNFADNSITSDCCPPPSHDAHISASWHTQLQLCAPTVVRRGKR